MGYPTATAPRRVSGEFHADFIARPSTRRGVVYSLDAVSTCCSARARTDAWPWLILERGQEVASLSARIEPWDVFENGRRCPALALNPTARPYTALLMGSREASQIRSRRNTYRLVTYARIDGFDPQEDYVEPEGRSLMTVGPGELHSRADVTGGRRIRRNSGGRAMESRTSSQW